jgi:hypothetical protein
MLMDEPMNDDRDERFAFHPGAFRQCCFYKHQLPGPRRVCSAFPRGRVIPDTILRNEHDHRWPWRGGSVVFEPREDVPDEVLQQLYTVLDRAK